MAADLKISELAQASIISADDISILVSNATNYQFSFATLLQFIITNLPTNVLGSVFTFATDKPQNNAGKNGDVVIDPVQQIFYQKTNGNWVQRYQVESSGSNSTTNSILYGNGIPAVSSGSINDTYINTLTGIFYKKSAVGWSQVFSMMSGPAGSPGPKGDKGDTGPSGKSVLHGTANPSNLITGTDGDFYINTSTQTMFGPKVDSNWGTGIPLVQDSDDWATKTELNTVKSALIIHPTYAPPSAQLSSPQASGFYEVGQLIDINVNLTFNQQDGGNATNATISKNGTPVSTGYSWTETLKISSSSVNYTASISYQAGGIKNNNFGDADAVGRITTGTTSASTNWFQGFYYIFYAPVGAVPNTSQQVRELSNSQLTVIGNSFTLYTGTTQKTFCFWLPAGKNLVRVIDQDALNADISSAYLTKSFSVNDAGGNAVGGTLYIMSNATPYSTNHKHLVTIS